MKSLWQASLVTCAALNRAASRLSMTMWRPLMPPEALHQAAKALPNWTNSFSRPGTAVLDWSLNTAMWMVLGPTPRTVDEPPGPGSQILPTPAHWPLVGPVPSARVAAPAPVLSEPTPHRRTCPASRVVATSTDSAVRRPSSRVFRNAIVILPLGLGAAGAPAVRPGH